MAESSLRRVMVAEKVDPQRLVFVDEMGANTSLSLSCMLGHTQEESERTLLCAPQPREEHHLARQHERGGGMGPTPLAVEGATDREVFEAYVEEVLAPSLRSGQIVVMDNLSAHKGHRVRELIEERGCELCCTCRPTPLI